MGDCKGTTAVPPARRMPEPLPDERYIGMFSGIRIGGLPTVQLNIIGNELSMLERGSATPRCLNMARGPAVPSVWDQARTKSNRNAVTANRPTRATGRSRSGLDTKSNRERCIGSHNL